MGGGTGILVETFSAFRRVYVKKIFARSAREGVDGILGNDF